MKTALLNILTILILFAIPSMVFAQTAPNLGTTVNFVLFTATGAVTNTGISQCTGNVGTNTGSTTGFGNVNGQMHDNDGTTGTAAADLLLAYNQLNTAIPTVFHAPLLGNGDTLEAGVYQVAGVSTLSGDLYLDGQGNPNAVFIFQLNAAFATNVASKVKLINGALACNVFWKVEGLVSMASGTYMRGTIVANNAAINLGTNDTLEGRVLSTAGAITTNGVMVYTPTGCGSAVHLGPACPDLASTAAYAIFSGNGAVTNAGITKVTGDVGTNVGLTTGYDALDVTGNIHPIPDGSTAACAADLLNVYNYLNNLPVDIELLYPAQFGNDLVLTPHTYLMNAATTFNGSVYLNGENNPNAVFVIKIFGALSTSTFSKVKLTNGTQASNVFWSVNGAVSINDYSVFKGTIVCNNGAISLTTGDSLDGRALTTNGALSTAAIVATIPVGGVGACSPLAVNWLYFHGKAVKENVLLEWGTAKEMNNSYFTIEKSKDGKSYEIVTTVSASSAIGNEDYHYSYTDKNPFSLGYYRISQTDYNGQKNYFRTIVVNINARQNMQVFHYVEGAYIYVHTSGTAPGKATLALYNIDGRKLSSQKIVLTQDAGIYKIEKPSSSGMYLIRMESSREKLYNEKLVL